MNAIHIVPGGTISVLDLPSDDVWLLEDCIAIRQVVELAGMREALTEPIEKGRGVSAFFPHKTHECLLVRGLYDDGESMALIGVPRNLGNHAVADVFGIALQEFGPMMPGTLREVTDPQN